jgi:uncharacterized protein YbjT (DUF2867 family)
MEIFVTGGTGYMGRHLLPRLVDRGYRVHALVRAASAHKLHPGCEPVIGDALDRDTFAEHIAPGATVIHLVGVSRPSPAKAEQFRRIDLASTAEVVEAALAAGASHFIYLSVAQPAPVMRAYVEARRDAEHIIRASGIPATFLRPWYVLGPGHYWPIALLPFYAILQRIPRTRDAALRLGFVNIEQMTRALVLAVQDPPPEVRIVEVPAIRR